VLFSSCNVQILYQNSFCVFYFPCTYTSQLSRHMHDETWKLRSRRCLLAQPCATVASSRRQTDVVISVHKNNQSQAVSPLASEAPTRLQLTVISHTHKSNIIPYFDSKCKINKAVIISGVSKLGHNINHWELETTGWRQRDGQCNNEARSCNHCCSGKAMLITYCVCVCSLRYPARNALSPCFRPWPAQLYNIFPHFFVNGTIFGKKRYWT